MTCNKELRGGGTCALDSGHRGKHTSIAFDCDGCGKTRAGHPYATGPDGEYPHGLGLCFLCAGPTRQNEQERLKMLEELH